jgi:hypothetical protein
MGGGARLSTDFSEIKLVFKPPPEQPVPTTPLPPPARQLAGREMYPNDRSRSIFGHPAKPPRRS